MTKQKDQIRAGTPEEIAEYERRKGGGGPGGGDNGPRSLREVFDGWTSGVRRQAQKELRKLDMQHTTMFNRVSDGGILGALQAALVLRHARHNPE